MADILTWTIQFSDVNPLGDYVANDVIKIYYDPDDDATPTFGATTGITAYKNDVQIFSGADILLANEPGATYKTESQGNNSTCNGTSRVFVFRQIAFPYMYMYHPMENYPACATAGVCDLRIIGTPMVVSASGSGVADGEVTISARSSQTIQYKLGSDFTYNDGTAQGTGVFTGLTPGVYQIYVRDATNCFADISVTIPFNNTYSAYYRLEYDDPVGGVSRIDIIKRDFAGAVTEVKGANIGFERSLKGEASLDKFESILATKATLHLTSVTDFYFSGLYTNNPEEFRFDFYKDGVLKGLYKVLPQQASEEYKAAPYYVSIVATDGLPSLKDHVFLQDSGHRFHDSMKAIELIAFILKKTKLELSIRCAINLYATGMATTAASDPLDQAYVDCDTYYINEAEPTLDYVLRQIIEPFGASIVQENAVWNIVRVEEKRAQYDYREFDYNGTYVSNSSYDPILDVAPVGSEGFHFSDRDHFMQLCPGYGKIRVFYRLGLRENILENGDFRLTSVYVPEYNTYTTVLDTSGFEVIDAGYPITRSWDSSGDGNIAWKLEGGTDTTGEAYILSDTYNIRMGVANTLKISLRYKLPPPVAYLLTPKAIPIPYQKVRVRIKYGSYYLLSNGTWSTTENFLILYVTEFNKFIEEDFIATPPDAGATAGYDFEIRLYHSYIYHAEFSTYDLLRAKVTYDSPDPVLPLGTRSEVSIAGAGESVYYYELEETTDAESEPNIVRPTDYHAVDNPVQWVLKNRVVRTIANGFTSPFWIDYIRVGFLTNGEQSVDTILREVNAEPRNIGILEKEVTHGSYQSLITTIPQWDFGIGKLTATSSATLSLITTNILSANILYAGYFRDSTGVGYATWTRDGISEQTSLHAILLQQYAAQYKRSWRKLTGSFYSQTKYFNFLNVLRVVNDSNRLYLPISPTIDDVNNRVRGEFLELTDITASAGSDGSGTSPFTSGFTTGFGAGYN